jgi:hypothetical protein
MWNRSVTTSALLRSDQYRSYSMLRQVSLHSVYHKSYCPLYDTGLPALTHVLVRSTLSLPALTQVLVLSTVSLPALTHVLVRSTLSLPALTQVLVLSTVSSCPNTRPSSFYLKSCCPNPSPSALYRKSCCPNTSPNALYRKSCCPNTSPSVSTVSLAALTQVLVRSIVSLAALTQIFLLCVTQVLLPENCCVLAEVRITLANFHQGAMKAVSQLPSTGNIYIYVCVCVCVCVSVWCESSHVIFQTSPIFPTRNCSEPQCFQVYCDLYIVDVWCARNIHTSGEKKMWSVLWDRFNSSHKLECIQRVHVSLVFSQSEEAPLRSEIPLSYANLQNIDRSL